jgi:hypothetical protein
MLFSVERPEDVPRESIFAVLMTESLVSFVLSDLFEQGNVFQLMPEYVVERVLIYVGRGMNINTVLAAQ